MPSVAGSCTQCSSCWQIRLTAILQSHIPASLHRAPLEPAGSSNFRLQLHQPKAPGCCRSLLIKVRPTPGAALCSVFGQCFPGTEHTTHTTCSIHLQFASHLPFNLLFCPFPRTFGNGCLAGKQNRILMFLLSLRAGQETRSKAHSQLEMSD